MNSEFFAAQRNQTQANGPMERIKDVINRLKNSLNPGQNTMQIKEIRDKCHAAGYSNEQIDRCLDEYENINVWQINQKRTSLVFV